MKTMRLGTKIISLIIAVAIFIGCCPVAFASNLVDEAENIDIVSVDENVALAIAAKHIVENYEATKWNENTRFDELIPFYDQDENVNAYCITLKTDGEDTGYVIISADIEQPLILEYSDESSLYIENTSEVSDETITTDVRNTEEHIYFNGPLTYSLEKDIVSEEPMMAEGTLLPEVAQEGTTDDALDDYNVNAAKSLVKNIQSALQLNTEIMPMSTEDVVVPSKKLPITDPRAYIEAWYGKNYSNVDYRNLDPEGKWIEPYIIKDSNACVLYATAAVIHYWRPSWSYSGIVNRCKTIHKQLWPTASSYYINNGYHSPFVREVLRSYSLDSWVVDSTWGQTWSKGKSEISAGNPCIICISSGGGYSDHAVTAYAWTTFHAITDSENLYLNFFKIQDGYEDKDSAGNKTGKSSSKYVCANFHLEGLTSFVVSIS